VLEGLRFAWQIVEGGGTLASATDQEVEYHAPPTSGLVRLLGAEALITVTEHLEAAAFGAAATHARGLPAIRSNEPRASCGEAVSMPNAT
jgi:hypothetical protein